MSCAASDPAWRAARWTVALGRLLGLLVASALLAATPSNAAAPERPDPSDTPDPPALVAVATNFLPTALELAERFHAQQPKPAAPQLRLTGGATGKLYAQLVKGAPYELFLAADRDRPQRLEQEGFIRPGSRKSYAIGTLVLWQRTIPERAETRALGPQATLRAQRYRRLALAQPALAPYGAASRQVLERMDLWQALTPKIVRGENVGQTFAMIASGAAPLGFVAASQLTQQSVGRRWTVPRHWHTPIDQQMVLLPRATASAIAFHHFLQTSEARSVIEGAGYRLPLKEPASG